MTAEGGTSFQCRWAAARRNGKQFPARFYVREVLRPLGRLPSTALRAGRRDDGV